jgi:putative solute:sodium symporter small subunit
MARETHAVRTGATALPLAFIRVRFTTRRYTRATPKPMRPRGTLRRMDVERRRAYWRKNLGYLAVLLSIWFVVSFGAGILFVDALDQVRVGGFKLGFWFAQQGAIYVFVALIFVYVVLMNRLDRRYEVDEREEGP